VGGRHRAEHHSDYPYAAFSAYAQQVYQTTAALWVQAHRVDLEDGWHIDADIGLLRDGRLFVRVYRGARVVFLRVLPDGAVAPVETRVLIGRWQDSELAARYAEFFWAPPSCIGLILHLASDTVPTEKIATFALPAATAGDQQQQQQISLVSVQTVREKPPYRPDLSVTYALHPVVHTGPEFPPYVKIEPAVYQCEGASRVRMALDGRVAVHANQDLAARDGKFGNSFTVVVDLSNPSDEDISIVRVSGEVKLGTAFVPAAGAYVGVPDRRGGHYFPEDGCLPIRLEKRGAVKIAVAVRVVVAGEPGTDNHTRQRAHASLPQPLKVRIVLEDAVGQTVSLVAEQVNPPLSLVTREERERELKCRALGFFHCDDLKALQRHYVMFYLAPSGQLVCRRAGTYASLDDDFFEAVAYKAKKAGQAEVPLDVIKDSETQLTALVDQKCGIVYALRVKLTTATGTTEGDFKLPDFHAARSVVVVQTDVKEVHPGVDIAASYRALVASGSNRVSIALCDSVDSDYDSYDYAPEIEGKVVLKAPTKPGTYEFRFTPEDKTSMVLAKSSPFIVVQ
jgi:hypothetical protein